MFRFAHISDLHLSPFPAPSLSQLFSKRVIGYLNWRCKRQGSFEEKIRQQLIREIKQQESQHLIISGDLVNLATPEEFTQAFHWLTQIGDPQTISIVPGNHDAYVPGALGRFVKIFKPWMTNDLTTAEDHKPFPYVHIRDKLAIIGLCSAIAQPPFVAAGYINPQQLKDLGQVLARLKQQKLYRVIVVHHPPLSYRGHWLHKLWNAKALQAILKLHGAELILHGHTHRSGYAYLPGPNQTQIPVVGVSAAPQRYNTPSVTSSYNLFDLQIKDGQATCLLSPYHLNAKGSFDSQKPQIFTAEGF